MQLQLKRQTLKQDVNGYEVWEKIIDNECWLPSETALILCDVWNEHWSRGANERLALMLPRINYTIKIAREMGVQVIHSPSDTMDFYEGTSARQRMIDAPAVRLPESLEHIDPPLPVNASDGGSDTGEKSPYNAWDRQHAAIEIDQQRDGISDDGVEIYHFVQQKGINNLLIMGVHTNMCILNRSFGIKQMVRLGMNVALVRDLTDAMYNPAMPPYVSHDEGTRLVIEYIEKFWCPTVLSDDIISSN
ncbi:isochorismatase family protein [Paenibacillus solisilvae]|uniref:Isochorismatase family protein n=1 Tax=Paenibacillus solisilvae TaxID=2486751 RepID=A0ABW0W7Y0_9BACL